jgi:hypothetical protein
MGRRPSPTGTPAESSGGWQDASFGKSDVLTAAATNPVRTGQRPYSEIGERLPARHKARSLPYLCRRALSGISRLFAGPEAIYSFLSSSG